MAYLKTVLLAIGLCFVVNVLFSVAHVALQIHREKATGIALTHRGGVESLLFSVVFGSIFGTVWYAVQAMRR